MSDVTADWLALHGPDAGEAIAALRRLRALRLLWVRTRRSHPEIAALALQELDRLADGARVAPCALHPTDPDGRVVVGERGEAAARLHEIWRVP